MKVRTNITLGMNLKERAQEYAANLEMDLSELVCHLLREELANPTIGQKKSVAGQFTGAHATDSRSSGLAAIPKKQKPGPAQVKTGFRGN